MGQIWLLGSESETMKDHRHSMMSAVRKPARGLSLAQGAPILPGEVVHSFSKYLRLL